MQSETEMGFSVLCYQAGMVYFCMFRKETSLLTPLHDSIFQLSTCLVLFSCSFIQRDILVEDCLLNEQCN